MNRIPPVPLVFGLGGLIPFAALSLASIVPITAARHLAPLLPGGSISLALATYGAVILSFLGGIRWGLALRDHDPASANRQIALSVVPSLAGWFALALPNPARLLILAACFTALGIADKSLVRTSNLPDWFGRLRIILSLGAVMFLLIGSLGQA